MCNEKNERVDEGSEIDVEEVYDETASFMASKRPKVKCFSNSGSGGGNPTWYEHRKDIFYEDPYDDDEYEAFDLNEEHRVFCNVLDINICGQIRYP